MIFVFDEFEFDPAKLELKRSGTPVRADALVLRLLAVLLESAGELVTKEELFSRVWGDRAVSENVITVAMVRLRKALGRGRGERELVNTVHGRGYRFARPVTRRARSASPARAPDVTALRGLPFIGRERALSQLRERIAQARRANGGLCAVLGSAGIGKTSVVEVLEQELAPTGLAFHWGYCREAGDTPPLWPFAQLLRGVLARVELDWSASRLSGAAEELARLLPELGTSAAAHAHEGGELAETRSHVASHRLFDAVLRVLTLAAELAPFVLVLDDLHRADAASLKLLEYGLNELGRTRVVVIATLRSGGDGQVATDGALAQVVGHRNCMRIAIERLSQREVATYVESLFADPHGELGRAVFAKSEGVPFFMAELARAMADADAPDPERLTVSDAALELVRQRVASLDTAARGVLSCAAVIGRSFELPLLQAVTGLELTELMNSLDDALAREVIVAAPGSKTAFAFGHDLLRSVLYERIPRQMRRLRHLDVAEALEARMHAGDVVELADLAYHLHSALPHGDLRKTVRFCGEAATAAANVCAYADAMRYVGHAREALELLEQPSPRLRFKLAYEQALLARVCAAPAFERLLREALNLAREQRHGAFLARAALLMDLHPGFPAMRGARAALEEALERLAPEDEDARAPLLARLATSAPLAYDAAGAALQIERARSLAPGLNRVGLYTVCSAELYLAGGPRHTHVAARLFGEIEEIYRNNPRMTVPPVLLELHRAITALQNADAGASSAALERCEARCREIGSRELLWHAERFRVLQRVNLGVHDGADVALRALHARAEREAIIGAAPFCAYDRALVPGLAPALDHAADCKALAYDADDPPAVWSLKVRALAALRPELARRALTLVPAQQLANLPCDRDYLGTLGALTRAALTLGELDYVEALGRLLAPFAEHVAVHVSFLCEGAVAELLGRVAQALGRPSAAQAHFAAALELSERVGLASCAARARHELDMCRSSTRLRAPGGTGRSSRRLE